MPSEGTKEKPKLTKLEKIAELQSKVKILQEENRRLKEISTSNHGGLDWGFDGGVNSVAPSPSKANSDVEKLKDALKALKRVTMKQEMTLSNLRQRAKQRRKEIEHKDKIIMELRDENKALKMAHEKIRGSCGDGDDVSQLKARLADLELQLAKEQTSKEEQKRKLKESQEGINNLQTKLATIKGGARGVSRHSSNASLTSATSFMSDGTSGEDLIRLKKELAKKAEKIANLQYDLENARDEIHDLKQKDNFNASFPLTTNAQSDDDFFETDDDDEDCWT
jgi:chromosome segregation ATPase